VVNPAHGAQWARRSPCGRIAVVDELGALSARLACSRADGVLERMFGARNARQLPCFVLESTHRAARACALSCLRLEPSTRAVSASVQACSLGLRVVPTRRATYARGLPLLVLIRPLGTVTTVSILVVARGGFMSFSGWAQGRMRPLYSVGALGLADASLELSSRTWFAPSLFGFSIILKETRGTDFT